MKRKGSAVWKGSLKDGQGAVSTESGVLDSSRYGFSTRFEEEKGTNPEELIGAAHASCFSMALSKILGDAGFTPDQIATEATVTLEKQGEGFAVTAIHLEVEAAVPGASDEDFQSAAGKAKGGCPISKLLKADITMDARLGGS